MDLATVLGGYFLALLRGMDDAAAERVTEGFRILADEDGLRPGERDIFRTIANSLSVPDAAKQRPRFEVITGGAA